MGTWCSGQVGEFDRPRVAATGRMAVVHRADPYLTFEEPTFVARFLLDPEAGTVATVGDIREGQ
jgi:hypothetical protein